MISSCKKETDVYTVSPQLKKWCYFSKGSYWIYRNDSTAVEDCTYVDKDPVSNQVTDPPGGPSTIPQHEVITISYTSPFLTETRLSADLNVNFLIMAMKFSNDYPLGMELIPPDNFIPSSSGIGETYTTVSTDSAYTVDSVTYFDVVRTKYEYSGSHTTYNFAFARNIGLLKLLFKSQDTTVSYSLVRYHIK